MTKSKFIRQLKKRLRNRSDAASVLEFYSESIDERIESGMSEEEAVAAAGDPDAIIGTISSELPSEKNHGKTWEKVLLIAGSPVWGSIALALICAALAIYIALWSIVLALYCVSVGVAGGVLCSLYEIGYMLIGGRFPEALFYLGTGFACAGLIIPFWYLATLSAKGVIRLNKVIFRRRRHTK